MKYANQLSLTKVIVSEDVESERLAQDLLMLQRMGKVLLYTHIPHETYTESWSAKRKNIRLGVRRGFPDYVIVTNNGKVLFVEMKKAKGGTLSPEQKVWLNELEGKVTVARVCRGHKEAMEFIEEELKT